MEIKDIFIYGGITMFGFGFGYKFGLIGLLMSVGIVLFVNGKTID